MSSSARRTPRRTSGRTSGRSRLVAAVLAMAACGMAFSATGAAAAPRVPAPAIDARAAATYWTAERMAAARPLDAGHGTAPTGARTRGLAAAAAPSGTLQGAYGDGIPPVGTFFSSSGPGGPTYCTASVVQSAGRNLVLTAGHCAKSLAGGQQIFVPQYRKGQDAAHQPYGVFPVERVFTDPRYTKNSKGTDSDLDFGFARLGANAQGAEVQDLTGGLRLTPTPRWTSTVTVTGYPGTFNPDQRAFSCTVPTARLAGYQQLQMKCGGFFGGTSGSPWISYYDAKARTGDLIGALGGWNGGGDAAGDDWVSYSPVFGQEVQDLYQDAVADRTPVRPTAYQPPSDAARLPGAASTWTHARHLASGDFTGDGREDLLTIWSDGEVSLYPGDGQGGFGAEKQLAKADSFWKRAETVTTGDFSGTGRTDLMVRWDNGKLSYYEDFDASGSGKEYTLGAVGSFWKYATQITAGRYAATDKAGDLAVRWVDGSLSVYSGVSSAGPGTERRLMEAGSYWRNATALTSVQPAGDGRSNLVVRWSDGSLGSYTTTGTDIGKGTRLQPPNASWAGAVMTAGDFTGTGRRDGLVTRWSNGETSLYGGTGTDALGAWSPLVQTG
ncbi:trypsin-like serine peptidase [Streptomyces eurocidicus]|uniref:V8-like Glu-specific endopeptidase n=2 Tax=Streptomyces eurocidicus TaxID=66423 RepID=A0A7W8F435_STREU|nr:FG-GAP-like repeat-containing protein [Streptomyces eurocidicus]MBB5121322.1 V8-like Glu-specific endopeptidase [Streptomyces eurocidicus]MBF6055927.1 trypsin-like serine protease [Streptomyces eurocidicus]